MLKLRRFLKDYKKECIIGPLCKLFEAILELLVPLVMADVIDTGLGTLYGTPESAPYVLRGGGLMVLLAVLGWSSAMFTQYFASKASQGAGTRIRTALYRHINTLSHAELDRLGTPSLITRMTNDVNQVQQTIAMTIRLLTRAPFIIIGSLVMTMTISPKLSLIFLAAAVVIGVTLYLVMSRSIPIFSLMQKKLDRIGVISRENLSGARVIRAFSKQNAEKKRVDEATDELAKTAVRVSRLSALLSPVTYAAAYLAMIAILWFGGVQVNSGELRTGDIIALISYMTQILLAMVVVANLVLLMTKSSASAKRINEVFETEPSVVERRTEPIQPNTAEDVPKLEFDNVSFNYGEGDDELSGVSLRVMRGQTLGIIGGTGSGKSTLVNLIPRFYDVKDGCVKIDGADVRDYPFSQLREQIGIVPQQSVLFSGTLRDNLRMRKSDATDDELIAALKTAQAYDFVSRLPRGLDSHVEQGGRNFSGGQRQRLCIARALVGKPGLLILDDSFSALDFATDAALRRALNEDTRGATAVIVAQRVSTVRYADRIAVLHDGELVGFGTHDELISGCETYREICLSQLSAEEVGA